MPAVHHYVPRFLLRIFCQGPKTQIWAYDKSTGRSFKTAVENVAGERDFYEMTIADLSMSLEEGLSKLEADASGIIRRIIESRSLAILTEDDRILLSVFVTTQMRRGPNSRESLIAIGEGIRKRLIDDVLSPELQGLLEMTPEMAKAISLRSLTEPDEMPFHILDKSWLLFETKEAFPFYISDNPVALQNNVEPKGPFRGNLGLGVLGIEIYLPISSTLTLGFYCKSHEELIRNGVERMRRRIVTDPDCPLGFGPLMEWMRAFREGTPLSSSAENVLNHNSLQVRQAERYVFSSQPDFSLVESMIADDPRFRKGPRPTVV